MEKAINLVINGGYMSGLNPIYHFFTGIFYLKGSDNFNSNGMHGILNSDNNFIPMDTILNDPLFWQCLGKALGWSIIHWSDIWHSLIDHLVEGKEIDEFFINLIK